MAAAVAQRGGGGLSLCLASAGLMKVLSLATFTLAWTHSIEKTVWQEDWSVDWDFGVPGDSVTPNSGEDWGDCRNGGRRPMPRHQKFFNAVFADGHVKATPSGKLRNRAMGPDDILHNHP